MHRYKSPASISDVRASPIESGLMKDNNNDETTDTVYELKVGTCGWDDPRWSGSFYPEELPEDWRLSYLASQVRAVLVPRAQWQGLDAAGLEQWREDTYPEFRFVLALDPDARTWLESAPTVPQRLAAQLGEQLGAWLLTLAPEADSAAAWRPWLQQLDRLAPVCIAPASGQCLPPNWQALCDELQLGLCWQADTGVPPAPGGRLLLALSQERNGRKQRGMIEQLATWMGRERQALLLFEGAAAPEAARQARIVAELLGV